MKLFKHLVHSWKVHGCKNTQKHSLVEVGDFLQSSETKKKRKPQNSAFKRRKSSFKKIFINLPADGTGRRYVDTIVDHMNLHSATGRN